MVTMATTINNPWISLTHQIPKTNCINHHYNNPFTYFKPTSNITLNPSNSTLPTQLKPYALLNPTISLNNIDYNDKIRQFCQVGKLKIAVNMLCESSTSNLDLGTYCLLLQLCAEKKSLIDGKKVHSVISSNSLRVDIVLGAKLVFMYVNCGDVVQAREIFGMIANEKVYLWNVLINEYAKLGDYKEGVNLYNKMWEFNVEPNEYTFSCVLKCFSGLGYLEEGEKAHGYLLKLHLGTNIAVVNSLISFYFKFGRVESAQKLFDDMLDRDVISWNAMISGYGSNGLPEAGIGVFEQMLGAGVLPNLATLVCVTAACADIANHEVGKMLHGYAVKRGFDNDLTCGNTVLDMYAKCGELDSAICVIENMGDRSIVSWTTMLVAYTREGLSGDAVRLFYEMKDKGIRPNTFAVTSVLNACASSGLLADGREVHYYLKEQNMQSDLSVSNALLDMYVKCGSMVDAELVFSQMPVRDIISWNTMIGGYSKNGLPSEALHMFLEMQRDFEPDGVTMSCVLPACASLAALEKGKEMHANILRKGHFPDLYVANAVVDMYVKCGALGFARFAFDRIVGKDLVSWTIMIAGYCIHGFGAEALTAFHEMITIGIRPNENSFASILYGCVHSGLLNEGRKFFTIMEKYSDIEVNLTHYTCLVSLMANAGRLKEAYNFIERMPIKPDVTIWGALLQGCRLHHDVKLAEEVANFIFELEPDNKAYNILLENAYTEAKTWEKVKWLQSRISHLGSKTNKVCSWIEVKDKVQIFLAGNPAAHPEYKKIEVFLKKLKPKMKLDNFSQKMYPLVSQDEVKEEVAVCGHSEASAIAYGVLTLAPRKTIRVTKNSKICHECHETAKQISRASGREIILRDSLRFHHFKDGICSCRS